MSQNQQWLIANVRVGADAFVRPASDASFSAYEAIKAPAKARAFLQHKPT